MVLPLTELNEEIGMNLVLPIGPEVAAPQSRIL